MIWYYSSYRDIRLNYVFVFTIPLHDFFTLFSNWDLFWSKMISHPLSDNTDRDKRGLSFISLNLYAYLAPSGMFLIFRLHFVFEVKRVAYGCIAHMPIGSMSIIHISVTHGKVLYFFSWVWYWVIYVWFNMGYNIYFSLYVCINWINIIILWLNFNCPSPSHARFPQRASYHLVVSRGLLLGIFKYSSAAAALTGVVFW